MHTTRGLLLSVAAGHTRGACELMTHTRLNTRTTCPAWCVRTHGDLVGEDDLVHVGEVEAVGKKMLAHLCMSVDPVTSMVDGPYVLLGGTDYTLEEARALGQALLALAAEAEVEPPVARG